MEDEILNNNDPTDPIDNGDGDINNNDPEIPGLGTLLGGTQSSTKTDDYIKGITIGGTTYTLQSSSIDPSSQISVRRVDVQGGIKQSGVPGILSGKGKVDGEGDITPSHTTAIIPNGILFDSGFGSIGVNGDNTKLLIAGETGVCIDSDTIINCKTQYNVNTPKATISSGEISTNASINFSGWEISEVGAEKGGIDNSILSVGITNNFGCNVYFDNDKFINSMEYIRIPLFNDLYTAPKTPFVPGPANIGYTKVYKNGACSVSLDPGSYICYGNNSVYFTIKINSDGNVNSYNDLCSIKSSVTDLYCESGKEGFIKFTLNPNELDNKILLYTDSSGEYLSNGYYIVLGTDNKQYLILTNSGALQQFNGYKETFGYFCEVQIDPGIKKQSENINIDGSDIAGKSEKVIIPGGYLPMLVDSSNDEFISVGDIIKLVHYFKYGEGKNIGPWATPKPKD